jgi:hypothetical protein
VLVVCGGVRGQTPTLSDTLAKLGAYLIEYESKVSQVVADEQYEQWIRRKPGYGGSVVARRKFTSTFFLMRIADGRAWLGLRDVFRVDGRPIPRPARSMEEILGESSDDSLEEAGRVMRENAKYNIGPVYRTINVPLQALELLHPRHRDGFQFADGGRTRTAGRRSLRIDFAEVGRPTLISDGFGGDRPASGRAFVDESTGVVLRTELRVGGDAVLLEAPLITVDYRRNEKLGWFLPSEMRETYTLDIEVLHGRAQYRNYRQFQTSARILTNPN